MILPPEALPLLHALAPAFTRPTCRRFTLLLAAALLTTGRRTIANWLRTAGPLAHGHRTTFQRVFSAARWSGLALGRARAGFRLARFVPAGPVPLVGDDTVDGHQGKRVYGKAGHRDPVRSTTSYTTWRYGHQWVVLAVLLRFPFATRPWALPVLVDLYRGAADDQQRRRRQRTPAQLMARLRRRLLGWFPERQFVFVGDQGYATQELARFARRQRGRLTLVSKFHADANLYGPAPPYAGKGRPRTKGAQLPKPHAVVALAARRRLTVGGYGGGRRRVAVVRGVGHWYKAGKALVPLCWVFVPDLTGTHRDEYFFSTEATLSPAAVIGYDTGRWNSETTFQEARAHLGWETTRGGCPETVRRAAPCWFGLYSVVAVRYRALPEAKRLGESRWPGKAGVTFADALAAVRRWLWAEGVFPQAGGDTAIAKRPPPLKEILLAALAPAA
jgi:hypothetical protein